MTTNLAPARAARLPHEDLPARFPEQISLLLNMIRLSRMGGIATVECDDIPLRKRLFQHFRQRLREANIYLYPVEIAEHDQNLVRLLRDLTERSGFKDLELIGRYENIALFAYGLEKFDAGQQEEFLASLNLFRDTTTVIKQPIIIWATNNFVSRMAREAPDFWSWKGMLFKFAGNGQESPVESRLPLPQRYLHDLLNDPDFAIWRDLYVPVHGFHLRTPPAWKSDTRLTVHEPRRGTLPPGPAHEWGRQSRSVEPPDNLLTLLAHQESVVVLGAPGAGKTTLLRYLAQAQARRAWKSLRQDALPKQIPVFIRLNLLRTGRSLEHLVLDALSTFRLSTIRTLDLLDHVLAGGRAAEQVGLPPDQRFLFLLDGLGEAPQERRAELAAFVQRLLPRHRVIVTCRSEDYAPLDGLRVLQIEPLGDGDIERYAVRYLGKRRGEQLAHEVLADRALTDLARSPLALYMLTRIADDSDPGETLPKNRGVLFQRFTDNLLGRTKTEWWRMFRRTHNQVAVDISRQALAELAYAMQQRRVASISAEKSQWIIREAAYVNPARSSAKDTFDALLHSGLIRLSEDRSRVEFMHQAVREYFAALKLRDSKMSIASILNDEQGRRTWGGTITLLFGIADDHLAIYRDIIGDGSDYQRLWLAARCLATLPRESQVLQQIGQSMAGNRRHAALFDFCRGLAFEEQGEFRKAIELFRRASRMAPDLSFAYYDLGCVFRQLDRPDYAVAALKEAIRRRPDFVDAYNHLGITFFEQEDYARALNVFGAAVELEPDNPHHYFNAGLALQVLRRYDQATQAFSHALKIRGGYEEASQQLVWLQKAKDTPALILLDHVEIFRALPLEQRLALAQHLQAQKFARGQAIVQTEQPAPRMFIIARGEVKVSTPDAQGELSGTQRLGVGDFFGEAILVEDAPRPLQAVAVTDAELLSLSREDFDEVTARFPALAKRLVQTRHERLDGSARRSASQPGVLAR